MSGFGIQAINDFIPQFDMENFSYSDFNLGYKFHCTITSYFMLSSFLNEVLVWHVLLAPHR